MTVPAVMAHMGVLCSPSLVDIQREVSWQPVPLASYVRCPRSASHCGAWLVWHGALKELERITPALCTMCAEGRQASLRVHATVLESTITLEATLRSVTHTSLYEVCAEAVL